MAKQLTSLELAAIDIVRKEKELWEVSTAFVTEKVAFDMRNLIRQLRKNYWGVFDKPIDPITGRKKIWIPFTESLVESVVKNIDLDTKDLSFRAKKVESIGLAPIVRSIVRNNLESIQFGEHLDQLERDLAIDGTAVWKTLEKKTDDGRVLADIRRVDLLNCFIDPTSDSIQSAYRFTERGLMFPDEMQRMKGWANTDNLKPSTGLSRTDTMFEAAQVSNVRSVDVWETWGKMPLWFFTGKKEDKDSGEEVEGRIVVSGLDSKDPRVHLIARNNKGLKPYEEAWYTRVSGRWYGRGVAEKLMMLQLWMNIIVNIRINRSYVSQLGIYKVKKGAGVTRQMLSRLAANGVIMVNDVKDIEQMVVEEASQASYNDEKVIQTWGERVSSAFEVVTGERLPSETTATAVAVQGRAAQSAFVLIKEGVGMFLQRWIKRHALPIIMKNVHRDDIVRLTGDVDEVREWDLAVARQSVYDELTRRRKAGEFFNVEEIPGAIQTMVEQFKKQGNVHYAKIVHDIDFTEFDVQVFVTNEELDPAVVAQNLVTMLQAAPQFSETLLRQLMDIMGLDANQIKPNAEAPLEPGTEPGSEPGPPPGGEIPPAQRPAGRPNINPQKVLTEGATLPR